MVKKKKKKKEGLIWRLCDKELKRGWGCETVKESEVFPAKSTQKPGSKSPVTEAPLDYQETQFKYLL